MNQSQAIRCDRERGIGTPRVTVIQEPDPIADFVSLLGLGAHEIRIIEADIDRPDRIIAADRYKKTFAFVSDDPERIAKEARRASKVSVYVTVNPVNPALAARSDRLVPARATAKDEDVVCIRFLFIDVDPRRPSGISSTDEELGHARAKVAQILADFPDLEPSAMFGPSGNGYWLLVRLPDYPNDDEHRELIARVTDWFHKQYSDDLVEIDPATKNPARIMALAGTMKCKGVDTPERPYRLASMDTLPDRQLVPFDLVTFAKDYCPDEDPKPTIPSAGAACKEGGTKTWGTKTGKRWTPYARAVAYARKFDPAISGKGGHDQTFYAACQLLRDFGDNGSNGGISAQEMLKIIKDEVNPRCQPQWSDKDLDHKIEGAEKKVPLSERGRKLKEESKRSRNSKATASEEVAYEERAGKLYMRTGTKPDDVVLLANFTARVVENITRHEGVGTTTKFRIAIRHHGGRKKEAVVASEKYSSMQWAIDAGIEHVLSPGQGVRDSARCGIQTLSEVDGVKRVEEHTALGWLNVDDGWHYLHANGAIGADGPSDAVRVDLCHPCDRYTLPIPTNDLESMRGAIRSHFMTWELADNGKPSGRSIAAIIATLVIRAVIAACNFTIHLGGPSGNRKTSIAMVVIQYHSDSLRGRGFPSPAGWRDTVNAIQRFAFDCRDGVLLIDDLKTPDQVATAEIIIQAQGNLQARARMNVDQSLQKSLPPRGVVLSTGEVDPRTLSTLGRTLVCQLQRGDVDLEVLGKLQELGDRGVFAQVTACYVRWLAPHLDKVRAELVTLSGAIARDIGDIPGTHPRHIDIVAQLLAAYTIFCRFAVESGAIDQEKSWEYLAIARNALVELGRAQAEHQEEAKPGRKFLDYIIGLLSSLRCHLANAENAFAPKEFAGACGWHKDWFYVGGTQPQKLDWAIPANSKRIGFIDETDGFAYLDPVESKKVACEAARSIRDPQSFDSIGRELMNENLVLPEITKVKQGSVTVEKRQAATQKRIPNHGGKRFYKIPIAHLFGEKETTENVKNDQPVPTVPALGIPEDESRDNDPAF